MPRPVHLLSLVILLFHACAQAPSDDKTNDYSHLTRRTRNVYQAVDNFLQRGIKSGVPEKFNKYSKIDTIVIQRDTREIDISFNKTFGTIPFRPENTEAIYIGLKQTLGRKYRHYDLIVRTDGTPIQELIPNFFRGSKRSYDPARLAPPELRSHPLLRNMNKPGITRQGLNNRNIALWHSHGWYYEQKLDRWEWQRARVFQTVEDLLPMAFTLPYLVPMLENAGAMVFLPRERDTQTEEIIVDNDTPGKNNSYHEYDTKSNPWISGSRPGFAIGKPPYTSNENPFTSGTSRSIKADTTATAKIRWLPNVSKPGKYGVYISYASSDANVTDAHYSVFHAGGRTDFLVNQQMGGGTWIYLGSFLFNNSTNLEIERVELTNLSRETGDIVSADGVRFGGGMGNIARNGKVSGRPRYVEAARYYLQYTGMPDSSVYNLNHDESDYKDDYQCRGEWVNYLNGAPSGPNLDRMTTGLNIPIDLSFAFHTDAGFTRNDTVIGTLAIYSSTGANDSLTFPNGMSRLANRDFTDILQTQLVKDIRYQYDPAWTRRSIWDRGYSEAYRPNVPAALLELLSHHNFLDMKFALDPRFRFDVSRSIYKAMLKFIATQHMADYTVQPLPVSHFQAAFTESGEIALNWRPVTDPLEPSAEAKQYILYTRFEDEAFDNGILIDGTEAVVDSIIPGYIYSFKVTALNEGGESFPSEILSVCKIDNKADAVLIINGFDRISAAATLETDQYLGFADFWDEGVPDKYDFNYIGTQYDFLASSPWLDDDAPGHGSSYGNYETQIIAGNTFDFPYLHGQSIKAAGYSFVSASDEAVMDDEINLNEYRFVDLILGEEKEILGPKPYSKREFKTFPKPMQNMIRQYCDQGGNLFISGAYVGSDLFDNHSDSLDIKFGQDVLKFSFRTDHAVKTGGVYSISDTFIPLQQAFAFNTEFSSQIYKVESPDAIEAYGSNAQTVLRYAENNTSAAIASTGESNIVIFGFPFETILEKDSRNRVMTAVLTFLSQ